MAGLQAPLSTLRLAPRDALRMTRASAVCHSFTVKDFTFYSLLISWRTSMLKFPFSEVTLFVLRRKMKNNVIDSKNDPAQAPNSQVGRYLQVCGSAAAVLVSETRNVGPNRSESEGMGSNATLL